MMEEEVEANTLKVLVSTTGTLTKGDALLEYAKSFAGHTNALRLMDQLVGKCLFITRLLQ